MDFIRSKLKKFDVHIKTIDGVNQKTALGAVITVVSFVIVVYLLISETSLYLKKDVVSRMVADTTVGVEDIALDFDLEFLFLPCEKITFLQEITRGTLHSHEPDHVDKIPHAEDSNRCRIQGKIVTDKAAGNFRFSVQLSDSQLNLSHRINHLLFRPLNGEDADDDVPDVSYPLHGLLSDVKEGVGIYQYVVQVVPTHFKKMDASLSVVNQYSVTERQVDLDQLALGVTLSGQYFNDFIGVMFTYDFSPIILVMEERQESIFEFLASLCGILGGVITVLRISPQFNKGADRQEGLVVVYQMIGQLIGFSDGLGVSMSRYSLSIPPITSYFKFGCQDEDIKIYYLCMVSAVILGHISYY